jgi:hypothetical protein
MFEKSFVAEQKYLNLYKGKNKKVVGLACLDFQGLWQLLFLATTQSKRLPT